MIEKRTNKKRATQKTNGHHPKAKKLQPSELKRSCSAKQLQRLLKEHKGEAEPAFALPFGQKRAVDSLLFGLDIDIRGYNIFILGPPGSGKTSLALRLIRERARQEERPDDICYVYHFDEPHRPLSVLLPSGVGQYLEKELRNAISGLAKSIFQTIYDEHFLKIASLVTAQARQAMSDIFNKISEIAKRYQLAVEHEEEQFMVVPLRDGRPIDTDVFEELPQQDRQVIQERISAFQGEAAPWIKAQRDQELLVEEQLSELEKQAIAGLVENSFAALEETFSKKHNVPQASGLFKYFEDMKAHLMEHYRELIGKPHEEDEEGTPLQPIAPGNIPRPYQINILVSHKVSGSPVIVEKEPTPHHLFGFLEYREGMGGLSTDHTLIRPGALHRANGGYLILQANDLTQMPEAWETFKRALRHRELRVRDLSMDPEKPRIHGTIRPKAMPLDVKVVLIGSAETYYTLMHEDEDFQRIFKVKSEFESWIERDEVSEVVYCQFLERICEEEGLLPPASSALALMVEESAREIESQNKLSTSVVSSIDLLCEANYWAKKRKARKITVNDILEAKRFRAYRHETVEKTIQESIDKGEMLIDTDGFVSGQINGLLVYSAMDYRFGIPTKITARTYAGNKGVINIDREAQLSGMIHDKGSMILVGLLGGLWGQKHPLAFNASITFEQNYAEIEGDSASCAEFYALLSSLADVPIYQGVAVTGSINQQGLIQPIGSVNVKIEGMFEICKKRGLTGRQGVIIPTANAEHLMLTDEVIAAVKAGTFHIWSVNHVSEAIEILMGIPAGERGSDGSWTIGSLFEKVEQRLEQLYEARGTNLPV